MPTTHFGIPLEPFSFEGCLRHWFIQRRSTHMHDGTRIIQTLILFILCLHPPTCPTPKSRRQSIHRMSLLATRRLPIRKSQNLTKRILRFKVEFRQFRTNKVLYGFGLNISVEIFFGLVGGILQLMNCWKSPEGWKTGERRFLLEGTKTIVVLFDDAATGRIRHFVGAA